jgi:hypothetical protein
MCTETDESRAAYDRGELVMYRELGTTTDLVLEVVGTEAEFNGAAERDVGWRGGWASYLVLVDPETRETFYADPDEVRSAEVH